MRLERNLLHPNMMKFGRRDPNGRTILLTWRTV